MELSYFIRNVRVGVTVTAAKEIEDISRTIRRCGIYSHHPERYRSTLSAGEGAD